MWEAVLSQQEDEAMRISLGKMAAPPGAPPQPHPKGCTNNAQRRLQAPTVAGTGRQPLLQPGRFYTLQGRSSGSSQPVVQAFPESDSLQPQHCSVLEVPAQGNV